MGKPTICIGENKGADQLCSHCEADQRLCFRFTDCTIPLLSKSKISSLLPSSVTVQPGLCRTWSEPKLFVFSHTGSYISIIVYVSVIRYTVKKKSFSSQKVTSLSNVIRMIKNAIL